MADLAVLEHHLARLARRSTLFPDRHLHLEYIVNMNAGSLYSPARAEETIKTLAAVAEGLCGPLRQESLITVRFHPTHYMGHAHEIAGSILSTIATDQSGSVHVIISVGGDGTHAEILSAFDASRDDGSEVFFLRLPFGTGNDGADAPDLAGAVRLLLGSARPVRTGELSFAPTGMSSFSAYNIGSLGLDAYVAYLTNRLRGRFAGDAYKLIADVMTLFYERIVGSAPMSIDLIDPQGNATSIADRFLLIAAGVTGQRRYGGGKHVLPGYENFCAIGRMGTVAKVRLKGLFYRGDHVTDHRVRMRSVQKAVVHYSRRIPMQLDGESVWLEPENFPLEIVVRPPRIPVLSLDQSNT